MARNYEIGLGLGIDELGSLEELQKGIPKVIEKAKKQLKELGFTVDLDIDSAEFQGKLNKLKADFEKGLQTGTINLAPGIDIQLNRIGDKIKESLVVNVQQATKAQEKYNKAVDDTNSQFEQLKIKAEGAAERVNRTANNDSRKRMAELKQEVARLQNEFQQLASTGKLTGDRFNEFKNKIRETSAAIVQAERNANKGGNAFLTLGEKFKIAAMSFALWQVVTETFYRVKQSFAEGVQAVIALDTAMVDLIKVTNETQSVYENFKRQSFEVADSIATTAEEVIKASTGFARMGYDINQSSNLGKFAIILKNVGDEIDTVDQATNSLIATMKGFNMESADAEKIVDAVNEVSNNFAVTTGDLTDGIERVSAVMSQSGVSFEQTLGLITGATEVMQDAAKASTGLRTLSERLRGVQEEGDEIVNLVPKLEDAFNGIGITLKDQNGQIRDTYSILKDLAEVYPYLDQNTKQYIGELSAGKRQIQTFNAIMMNFATVQEATETAMNSAGSAINEQSVYYDSLQGKIERITNRVQQFWAIIVDSDAVSALLDALIRLSDSFVRNASSVETVINGMAMLIDIVTLLNDNIGLLEIGVGALNAALVGKLIKNTVLATIKAETLAVGIERLAGVSVAMGGVLSILATVGFFALSVAIATTINDYIKFKQEQQELTNKIEQTRDALSALSSVLVTGDTTKYASEVNKATQAVSDLGEELGVATQEAAKLELQLVTTELARMREEMWKNQGSASEMANTYARLEERQRGLSEYLKISAGLMSASARATLEMDARTMDLIGSQELLKKAMEQSKNTGEVSNEVMRQLLKVYPELADASVKTANGYKIEQSAIKNLSEANIRKSINSIQASKAETAQVIADTEKRMRAALAEAKAQQAQRTYINGIDVTRYTNSTGIYTIGRELEKLYQTSAGYVVSLSALNSLLNNIGAGGSSISYSGSASGSDKDSAEKTVDLLQERVSLENEIASLILDRLKTQKEENVNVINERIEQLKEQLKLTKEQLEYEKNRQLEILNIQKERYKTEMDMLKQASDARKQEQSIQDLQSEIALQQQRVNILKQDPTRRTETVEAEKQLTELRKQLAEELFEKEFNAQQDLLQGKMDAISLEEDAVKNNYESQIQTLEDSIEAQTIALEAQRTAIETAYNNMISNSENYWNQVMAIINGGQSAIVSALMDTDKYRQAGLAQRQAYLAGWGESIANLGIGSGVVTGGATGVPTTPSSKSYTVQSGDSLAKIASRYGTTWQKIYEANKAIIGSNPNFIKPGQNLTIPAYAQGGVNTSGGLAMLHGSKTRPEFIMNYDQMKNMMQGQIPEFMKPYLPDMAGGSTNNFNLPSIIVNIANGAGVDGYKLGQQVGKGFIDNVRKYNGNNGLVPAGLR